LFIYPTNPVNNKKNKKIKKNKKMTKKILYQEKARRALERGMGIMAEAVSVTLGPKGRNVVLDKKYGSPQIINDGVTIAKEVELADHIENTGVSLLRQAASKTNDVAGDGTTTATVLAYAIVKQGMKNVAAGANPISLKLGIEKATKYITNQILEHSRPIENNQAIAQVASISAGNDPEVGQMIAGALEKVGRDGIISLEEGKTTSTELEITEGMRFEKGFISPYFVTNPERMEAEYQNCYILVTDKKITLVQQDLIPILEKIAPTKQPVLIIAEDVEKEALATLVLNKLRGIVNLVAVRAPGFGDFRKSLLEDIAILTNGVLITEDTGLKLENIELNLLGSARRVIVKKDSTTIVCEGNSEAIRIRCEQLRKQISSSESAYEKEKLQDRIAKLSGGIAVIKVGAVTETEMKDKKLRLEDAINATKAAVEEGIVPGGGTLFVHLAESLKTWAKANLKEDELVGALIIARAIVEPLKRIAENAGKNGVVIIEAIQEKDFLFGYNAATDEFGNMFDFGIVDPAKVTRSALQNAASIASMILTTECIVVDKDETLKT
jgi:chaperonin GroEL